MDCTGCGCAPSWYKKYNTAHFCDITGIERSRLYRFVNRRAFSGLELVCINRFLIRSDAWFTSATIAGLFELLAQLLDMRVNYKSFLYLSRTSFTKSIAACSLSSAEAASSPGISTSNRRTKPSIPLLIRLLREDMIALFHMRNAVQFRVIALNHSRDICRSTRRKHICTRRKSS